MRTWATLLLSLLVASTAGGESGKASAGCASAAPIAAGTSRSLTLEFDGLVREYRLHLPPGYEPTSASSLLLHFHGYTGSALHSDETWTHFSELADREGFIVVYPQSTSFA